jgi:hypothetical protein
MQRTCFFSACQVFVSGPGLCQNLFGGHPGDDGIHFWVDTIDLCQMGFHYFQGGQFLCPDTLNQFCYRHEANLEF